MPGFIALAFPAILTIWLHGPSRHVFDAQVPQRCATFEQAYAPSNKPFCHAWFAAHRN
jgi:hypothetical protein